METHKFNTQCVPQSANKIDLNFKIQAFSLAMEKYNNNRFYTRFQKVVSVFIMFFQALTLFNLCQSYQNTHFIIILCAFIFAYLITDFINGMVHMYMDNNTSYSSIVGPFIAAFHLHHLNPRYSYRHPLKIYFSESGTKFWLLGYLLILAGVQKNLSLFYGLNVALVSFGILSSVAELSHYWCHNASKENKIIQQLQKYRLLLSMQHHIHHHRSDNTHYAFLNGLSDPLLNRISRYYYAGYKNNADYHTKAYVKLMQQDNKI